MTGKTHSVAVIDDTQHVREMLVSMLNLDGFEVVGEGTDAEDAVSIAADTNPDVIVMDYAMPGENGLEAARRILEARPGQKIILYTAYLDDEVRKQAKQIGVAACLSKLEGLESLEGEIVRVCRQIAGRAKPAK